VYARVRIVSSQVLIGCCLAFANFGVQMSLQPYRENEANKLKVLVDIMIFLVFLISFVLRVAIDIRMDDQRQQYFASLLLGSIILLLLASVLLTVKLVRRRRKFRKRLATDGFSGFEFSLQQDAHETMFLTNEDAAEQTAMALALRGGLTSVASPPLSSMAPT